MIRVVDAVKIAAEVAAEVRCVDVFAVVAGAPVEDNVSAHWWMYAVRWDAIRFVRLEFVALKNCLEVVKPFLVGKMI